MAHSPNVKASRELISSYRRILEDNISAVNKVLKRDLDISEPMDDEIKNLIAASSADFIQTWLQTVQHGATLPRKRGGRHYTPLAMRISSILDNTVHIMDDILPCEADRATRALRANELVRALASCMQSDETEMRTRLASYFEKSLTIALTEKLYLHRLSQAKNFQGFADNAANLYHCLSLDVDVVGWIMASLAREKPWLEPEGTLLVKGGRILRALTIIQRDLEDLESHGIHGTPTAVRIASQKGFPIDKLVESITSGFRQRIRDISSQVKGRKDLSDAYLVVADELTKQIRGEVKKLIRSTVTTHGRPLRLRR